MLPLLYRNFYLHVYHLHFYLRLVPTRETSSLIVSIFNLYTLSDIVFEDDT